MESISLKNFLKSYKKNNPKNNIIETEKVLIESIKAKKLGVRCIICGSPIWAIGSALCGSDMCFSCITGEKDSSEDYEIDEVNY